ncbi:MAG: hypothetical protein ACRDOM_03925 [Nocardioides sp.]
MAATIFVEVETGTCTGRVHPHNGYYAGDFSIPRTDATGVTAAAAGRPRS